MKGTCPFILRCNPSLTLCGPAVQSTAQVGHFECYKRFPFNTFDKHCDDNEGRLHCCVAGRRVRRPAAFAAPDLPISFYLLRFCFCFCCNINCVTGQRVRRPAAFAAHVTGGKLSAPSTLSDTFSIIIIMILLLIISITIIIAMDLLRCRSISSTS